jgi:Tetracyclin repressor-like, C-terminal domain
MVMFALPSKQETYPQYAAAGNEAFETLLTFIVECQETGVLSAGDPQQFALMSWSIVHGVAKLAISNHFAGDAVRNVTRIDAGRSEVDAR